jgi:hypothetical protein
MCCFYMISYQYIKLKVSLHANMDFLYLLRCIPNARLLFNYTICAPMSKKKYFICIYYNVCGVIDN